MSIKHSRSNERNVSSISSRHGVSITHSNSTSVSRTSSKKKSQSGSKSYRSKKSKRKVQISSHEGRKVAAINSKDGTSIRVVFSDEDNKKYLKWRLKTCCLETLKACLVFVPVAILTITVVTLLVLSTLYIINADHFSFSSMKSLAKERVQASIASFLHERTYIVRKLESDLKSGNFDSNLDVDQFEKFTSSVVINDPNFLAMYMSNSNRRVWKIHRESPGVLSTQIRMYVNESYQYRYERVRPEGAPMSPYNVTDDVVKTYHPFLKSWYVGATATYPLPFWQGPEYLADNSDLTDKDVPIMIYNKKVHWKNSTKHSIFKLKIMIDEINHFFRDEETDYMKIAAIDNSNTVVSYRDINLQFNLNTSSFRKIWELQDPLFNSLQDPHYIENIVKKNLDNRYLAINVSDIGWFVILAVDKIAYQKEIYYEQMAIFGLMGISLIVLCLVVTIVGYLFLRIMSTSIRRSKESFITKLVTLKQGKAIEKYNELDDIDILLKEQAVEKKSNNVAKIRISKKLFEIKYEDIILSDRIGGGGSGAIVYKAKYKEKDVAFKVFKMGDVGRNAAIVEELEREIQLFSSLRHPNVLTFYGCSLREPRVGIVTEYCPFGDIKHFILNVKRGKITYTLDWPSKLRLLKGISDGMEFLHEKDVVHRDLKCENVLVNSNHSPKVFDFGLSKILEEDKTFMTKKIGTSFYMAPEITLSNTYGKPVDVFSFAIVMWCVLKEEFLPYGKDCKNVELRVANDEDFRPSLKAMEGEEKIKWYVDLMKKLWGDDPLKRGTFKEIGEVFADYIDQEENIDVSHIVDIDSNEGNEIPKVPANSEAEVVGENVKSYSRVPTSLGRKNYRKMYNEVKKELEKTKIEAEKFKMLYVRLHKKNTRETNGEDDEN